MRFSTENKWWYNSAEDPKSTTAYNRRVYIPHHEGYDATAVVDRLC